jgi:ketosteroid isomerase-like protein
MATATMKVGTLQDQADILALIDKMHKANYDKDAAGFVALFDTDAAVFNLAPPLVHHGINLQEKQAWFDSWDGRIELEARNFDVTVSGEFAFCHGFMHTLHLKREVKGWKIIHEHTSVPFYMDGTQRAAFDLKP